MKRLAVVVAVLALCLGVALSSASAEEPPLDVGESNLLVLACGYMQAVADREQVLVRWCRRAAPDEITLSLATIHVALMTDLGLYHFSLNFRKSLWWVQGVQPS